MIPTPATALPHRPPASSIEGAAPIERGEKVHAPIKIAAIVKVMVESGARAEDVLVGTGLDVNALGDPDTRTSFGQFLTAARNAVRLYGGSDGGLRVGQRLHASSYGMYGYALLCSETMRHAFDTGVRYHRLANPTMPIRWRCDGDMAKWFFPTIDELVLRDLSPELHRFLFDLQVTAHITITKDVMGAWCVPAKALIAGPAPPHASHMAQVFGCPLEFDQPGNELHYPADWLDRAPQLANAMTATQVSRSCARLLEEFKWQCGITRRVYEELTRTPGRFPDLDTIAASLCMTSRTLRRKLEAEGSSYVELLDGVRRALAIDYLRSSILKSDDIAAALGFSDAASFRRAFKRWTGKTPNEYRA